MTGLKKRREELGLKQIDIVKKTGLSKSTISLLESGQLNPSLKNAFKIAKILDTTVETLFMERG